MRGRIIASILFIQILLASARRNTSEESNRSSRRPSRDDVLFNYSNSTQNETSAHQEAIRRRKAEEFKRRSQQAVRDTIDASRTESCEVNFSFDPFVLVSNTLRSFKGEMCGSYYKILDVDKNTLNANIDENERKKLLKKKYRQLSLTVHPDKHGGSAEAHVAFEKVQDAFDCLSDDSCRQMYDNKLNSIELSILQSRLQTKDLVVKALKKSFKIVHYYISVAAYSIHRMGSKVASFFDKWRISLFEDSVSLPIGKMAMWLIIALKAKSLFLVYGIAYTIVALNNMLLSFNEMRSKEL